MSKQRDEGAGGNGTSNKPTGSDFKGLINEYLDSIANEDTSMATPDTTLTSSDVEDSSVATEDRNKKTLSYQGQMRTTTGIVKIMRESGNVESADLLEELRQTQESAKQLLDQLRDLHRRKTGVHPRPARVHQRSE